MSSNDRHKVYFSVEEDRHGYGGLFSNIYKHGEYSLGLPTRPQQTNLNPLESSSFQCYHHTVHMNCSTGEWFRSTVGVRQECLFSSTLFNFFLERIMSDALEEHDGKISTGGKSITSLRFADDIDALTEKEQKLEALLESLDKIL